MGWSAFGSPDALVASAAPVAAGIPQTSTVPVTVPAARWTDKEGFSHPGPGPLAGLGNVITDIFNSIGIRDPIKVYEPALATNLPAVFAKYRDQVVRYSTEVRGLRSDREVKRLTEQLGKPARLVAELDPAFSGSGMVGKRERDQLAELVQLVRNFRADFGAAKKRVGWAPPEAEAEAEGAPPLMVAPAPATAQAGLPWGLILAGAAVAFLATRN